MIRWTIEKCREEALKYNTRNEFKKNNVSAFSAAYVRHKCLDEICSHMKPIGNKFKRCIYVYEFSDNNAYIGLTSNIDKRNNKHLKRGPVYEHIKINKEYKLLQLTEYVDVDKAKILENDYVVKYIKNNWYILNKAKTGAIGSHTKIWIKEKCRIEALKYNRRIDFCLNSCSAYRSSLLNDWLDEVCEHMNIRNTWTKENCKDEALKYNTRFEFSIKSKPAYMSALNNKWLDEICEHMGNKLIKRDFWSYDECKIDALKYKSRGDFSIKSPYAYKVSRLNKWLDEFYPKINKN